jgi:hypothetical protein
MSNSARLPVPAAGTDAQMIAYKASIDTWVPYVGLWLVTGLTAGDVGTNAAANLAALQSVLDAAEAAGGGRVVSPAGIYQFSGTANIGSRVTYEGNGWGTRHKLANGASTTASPIPVLAAKANSNYVGVRNIYIDGNKANQPDTNYSSNGIDFYSRGTTESVGAPTYDGSLFCEHVMVFGCKGVGFYVRGDSTTMRVVGCSAYHNDDAGYWFKTDCEAANCIAANNGGYGFRAYAGTSIRWTSLKAFGNCQRYSGCDFLVGYCTTVIMTDCQAEDSGQAGFVWTACSHVTATDCVAYRCAGHLSDSLKSAFWVEDDGAGNLCNHFTLTGSALCNGGADAFNYALTTRNLGPQCEIRLKTEGYAISRWNSLGGSTDGAILLDNVNRGSQTVAYAASITPDQYKGEVVLVGALTGGITVNNPAAPFAGQRLAFRFLQDATGGRAITWGAAFTLNGWTPPSTAANARYGVRFVYDGTAWVRDA